MKIGPFQLVRAARDTAQPTPAKGASGTVNQSGFLVDDEYNADLYGERGLKTFRRMTDSDGAVREAWLHIRAPLTNAEVVVEPASDDPLHLEQAELIRRALFDFPAQSFRQVLPTLLKYMTQGFQVYELPEMVVDVDLSWEDPNSGETSSTGRKQFLVWEHFAHRKPETIYKWNVEAGHLVSVVQIAYKDGSYGEWTMDAENLLVLVNDREGDDFTGQSILRPAYKAWYLKELVEKINAIAIERHGVGINVVYVPKSSANDDALIDRLEQMLGDLSAGERPFMVMPGPKGQASGTDAEGGFWFEVVTPAAAQSDNTPFLGYLRGEIKGSMLVRFSELGHGQTGARATGDVQSKVWYDALHGAAFHIADTMRPAIRRLLERNYPTVDEIPKIVFRNIDARSLTEFADAVTKLTMAEMILPDKSARQAVRSTAGLPDEDEDAAEQVAKLKEIAQPAVEPLNDPSLKQENDLALSAMQQSIEDALVAFDRQTAEKLAALAAQPDVSPLADELARQSQTVKAALDALPAVIAALPAPTVTIDKDAIRVDVAASEPHQMHLTIQTPTGAQRHELTFDDAGKVTGSVVTPIEED